MGNDNNNAKDTEIQQPHETSSFIDSNANNTAHPSDEHHQAVTSNNPTSESIQQPSYQQLHEAMLAAVNSHGVGSLSPHGLVAAAAAAMAAAASSSSTPNASPISPTANASSTTITQSETTPQVHHSKHKPLHELDVTKRESIRAANRERKKKWRIHNEERNKDNDLRCRVNKRATKLYGTADTPEKKAWAQEEFEKRRQKRMEKERRKNAIDNVLSVPGSPHLEKPQEMSSLSEQSVLNGVSDQLGYYNMQQQQQQAPPLVDPAAAAKMLDFPPELQRQLLEQLNNMIAMTNNGEKLPSSSTSNDDSSSQAQLQQQPQDEDQVAPNNQESTHEEQGLSSSTSASNSAHNSPLQDKSEEEESKDGQQQQQQQDDKKPEYPMDAVLTLMQLNAGWRE
ncbi:hypothetical protein O0I10_011149 [Lichtheimia ornata]|uniref:DUF3020 domain-containing protein n=1 Tax=Lichtheimia ornata TaxID=688661 RepID=A0AAD7UTJ1_9FUNG|nr:uncharacterized protein O0I10_011149 [Lichtheimia ornata]KAJ8653202.1 hypothetical protein O0I10_011149 [Lichtheimia ornata]